MTGQSSSQLELGAEPSLLRHPLPDVSGGHAGWWLLRQRNPHGPDWDELTLVCIKKNARPLSLQLGNAPSAGGAKIVRIPDDISDVFVECSRDHVRLDLAMRRLGKIGALLQIMRGDPARARSAYATMRSRGLRGAVAKLYQPALPVAGDTYRAWLETYDRPRKDEAALVRNHMEQMAVRPTFSIVVPVYNTPLPALEQMIASVRAQLYPHWELCIADDNSTSPDVRPLLERYAALDARIKVVIRSQNGNISACSNSALDLAAGDYVALLDHDDLLAPHALATMADAIARHPDADIFYSDEDKLDANGRRYDPYFKPDFNRELLYGQNFINHLSVFRTSAMREVGGFRLGFEGSQDYDLVLRLVAHTKGPIIHVPHVLYHWRLYPGAQTFSSTQLERASLAARRALAEHLAARGQIAVVEAGAGGYHRVRRTMENWPRVSVVVPTRDHADILGECMRGLLDQTDYPDLEIIIADNDSREPATSAFFDKMAARGVKIVPCPGPFNYSKINNDAVRQAQGEHLLFLNNDISVIEPGWLKEMAALMQERDVGAVGAKLFYPDGTLQHGGVTLGILGVAGHTSLGAARHFPGYFGQLGLARDVSCATAACLLVRRSVFERLGGFDETHLKVAFNDVDLCIRIGQLGYRIVWTPYAQLVHHESKTRGTDTSGEKLRRFQQEVGYMRQRWADVLDADPYWNPNLSLESNDPEIAFPPRVKRPWDDGDQHLEDAEVSRA